MRHAWPYSLCRRVWRVPRAGTFILGVLVVWFVGLGIAALADATTAHGDVLHTYFHTRPAYLGIAGIISVWLATIWADGALNRLVETVPPAFAQPEEARKHLVRARELMVSWWQPLLVAFVLWLGMVWYLGWVAGPGCGNLLSDEWYAPETHFWTTAILLWYGIPVLALLATTINGAIWFSLLVRRLGSLRIAYPIASSVYRLRAVVQWGRTSGFWWSVSSVTIIALLEPAVTRVVTQSAKYACTPDVWVSFHSMTLGRDNVVAHRPRRVCHGVGARAARPSVPLHPAHDRPGRARSDRRARGDASAPVRIQGGSSAVRAGGDTEPGSA